MSPFVAVLLHASVQISWTDFSVHESTVIGLLLLSALYFWRARRGAAQGQPPVSRAQQALFVVAVVTMFMSLNGWLHDLSDYYLFSAHMVQHLLLALVIAPLFIMGTPGWMLKPLLTVRGIGPMVRWLARPIPCFAIFNVVVALWHLPVMYNAAMANHPLHIVQHLTFLAAAVLMWWPILSPLPELPRLSYPGQILYLFLMSLPMTIVAVYIALATSILYPAYAAAPRLWGLTPMNDQLIGGLIMWIPGGLFFYAVLSVVFYQWQARNGVDTRAGAQADWRPEPGGLPVTGD